MRDRDRVLYSNPFRILSGKTQVYISGIDDNMRTRLTHTLEVSQIARTIAGNLKLDTDLAEAIALGHDIGHTPYGHAGERILHEIMTPHYNHAIKGCPLDLQVNSAAAARDVTIRLSNELGFKHNLHSVEVAICESEKSKENMLFLTNFTLFGMKTHSRISYKGDGNLADKKVGYYSKFEKYCKLPSGNAWSFESVVVREADEIAQRHHDLEDAIRGRLISRDVVCQKIEEEFKEFLLNTDLNTLKEMKKSRDNDQLFYAELSRLIVNLFVARIVKCSIYNLNKFIYDNSLNELKFPDFMLNSDNIEACSDYIAYDRIDDQNKGFTDGLKQFEDFISDQVHAAYDIQKADAKGVYIIKKLFQAFYNNPQQLPDNCVIDYIVSSNKRMYSDVLDDKQRLGIGTIRKKFVDDMQQAKRKNDKVKLLKLMRAICNFIASMTDHQALEMYQEMY